MSVNRFQDDAALPAPSSKKRKGLLILAAVVGMAGMLVVLIKSGSSTKDPKKAVTEAGNASRVETGEATSHGTQGAVESMVGTDGAHTSVGANTEKEINDKIDRNMKAAEQARLDSDREAYRKRREDERRREGLPGSLDAQGRPVDAQGQPLNGTGQGQGQGQGQGPKVLPIPGFASGWNPEQDIVVPGGDGLPSYRYIPAYLRGTNNPSEVKDIKKLEDHWLNSISKPSYGASHNAQLAFNEDAVPRISIGRAVRASGPIQAGEGAQFRQPAGQTAMECAPGAGERRRKPSPGGAQ